LNTDKCPICKTDGFEITMYEEEGGYCENCKIWVVPEQSVKGINKVRGSENLNIQFHKNGIPTFTWEEYQEKLNDDDDEIY